MATEPTDLAAQRTWHAPARVPWADPSRRREAVLVLAGVDGVGDATFWELVSSHGGAGQVLASAAAGRLSRAGDSAPAANVHRLPETVSKRIREAARNPRPILDRVDQLAVWTVDAFDADYPERLRILDPPPPVLYGWGDRSTLAAAASVAVVGTRRPTIAGRSLAARIAVRLVDGGAVVVSGLAIGIDGAAHAATVARGGSTIAVLGGGHGSPGPRAHRQLLRAICDRGGAVISELPPAAVPSRGTFPRRNRIISALSDAVIVVEAPTRSGALITARHGLEQGRGVFVAPGRLGDPSVAGCLALLRETPARVIAGLDELMLDLELAGPRTGQAAGMRRLDRAAALAMLPPAERTVARALCDAPGDADRLVDRTGFTPQEVAAALTLLTLRGWVHASGPAYLPAGPLLAGS